MHANNTWSTPNSMSKYNLWLQLCTSHFSLAEGYTLSLHWLQLLQGLPRKTMSVTLAGPQSSHLLSRAVTPVPLTQLPQRNPVEFHFKPQYKQFLQKSRFCTNVTNAVVHVQPHVPPYNTTYSNNHHARTTIYTDITTTRNLQHVVMLFL